MHALGRSVGSLVVALCCTLSATEGVRASGFQYSPTRVDLTARDHVASITLTNNSDTPERLEVEALRWTQGSDGQPALNPSQNLLVFPQLLTIPPREQRRLRVAVTDPTGPVEISYKISITEIPSFSTLKTRRAGVTVALQVDMPVFVAPTFARRSGAIVDAAVQHRKLAFAVNNIGTVHFVSKQVFVTGLGADTHSIFTTRLDDGEVLAGSKRALKVDLPRNHCSELRAVSIHLVAGDQRLTQTLNVPAGACNP